jgi:ElaB/YqjD/DUF883 family membrane-anchored ribosome-binding protein
MIRLPDHVPSVDTQRARDELSAVWEHLVAAAEHGTKQVERASRRRGALARSRAAGVRRAVRGDLPESPWRWLGVGLAAGVVIGAVGTAVLTRRLRTAEESGSEQTTASAVRERAASAVAGVREQASAAAHGATSAAQSAAAAARDTVGKVREKIGGDDDPEAGPPPAAMPPPGPAS